MLAYFIACLIGETLRLNGGLSALRSRDVSVLGYAAKHAPLNTPFWDL